jgi:predicted DNA binding protein
MDSDLYVVAWIGEPAADGDGLVRRVGGGEESLIEAVCSGEADSLERAAVDSGELQVVDELAEDQRVPEAVRRAAFASGLQSGLAVPLTYGGTDFGVLGVYAARADAFGRHERLGFATLAEVVGLGITAARQRNLLLSDTVLELGLEVSDPGAFLASASQRLDAVLTVEGIVPQDEESLLFYVLVEGADPERLIEEAADATGVEPRRVVQSFDEEESEPGGLVELSVSGASPVRRLAAQGTTVRTARYEAGTGRVVAEASPDASAREVIEAVTEAFPDTELVTKRERQREVETAQEFRSDLRDRLTDRQLQALRTAFLADYFESPRGSTAREVGDALDITAPTLLHHLRAAQRKLLESFFEEDAGRPVERRRDRDRDA